MKAGGSTVSVDVTNNSDRVSPSNFDDLLTESNNKLTSVIPTAPLSFRFDFESINYSARISESEDAHQLVLLADMGHLPYSSELPEFRDRLLGLLAWDCDEETFKFVLDPKKHKIYLMLNGILKRDITGTDIIGEIIATIIKGRPFIQLAREVGWTHPEDTMPKSFNVMPDGLVT